MRLIDADELISILEWNKWREKDKLVSINSLIKFLKSRPADYDVDKVVEQLDKMAIPVLDEDEHIIPESNIHEICEIKMVDLSSAIEIVKGGGVNDD